MQGRRLLHQAVDDALELELEAVGEAGSEEFSDAPDVWIAVGREPGQATFPG